MKLLQLSKCRQKNSKRGGMLVVVLMIFAVSLILISSAMSITLSSRSRYYVDAERSQERLTLTCAAEAVIDAIEKQEITDSQLLSMADDSKPYKITGANKTVYGENLEADADKSKAIAPGLVGSEGNETYMTVSKKGGTSKNIILEFSTKIDVTKQDGKSENLRVELEYFDPPKVDICSNMVTIGDEGSQNSIKRIWATGDGYHGQAGSFMVFHGECDVSQDAYSKTPVVFTGKVSMGGSGTYFKNDVILWGPNASLDASKAYGNGLQIGNNNTGSDLGGVFFLGVGCESSANKQKIWSGELSNGGNITTYGAFFYHATGDLSGIYSNSDQGIQTVVKGNGSDGVTNNGTYEVTVKVNDKYEVTSSSKGKDVKLSDDQINKNIQKVTDKAKAYIASQDLKKAVNTKMPNPSDYQTKYVTDPNGFTVTSGTQLLTGNEGTIYAGKYEMKGNYNNSKVLNVDLTSGNAYIYVSDNTTFGAFRLNISNKTANKCYIVIAYGKTLTIDYNAQEMTPGISSCDSRRHSIDGTRTGGGNNINIQNKELNGGSGDGWDCRPSPGQSPACVIIGLGKNTVTADGNVVVLDAYVSLAGKGVEGSTFCVKGKALFYGRFESDKFVGDTDPIGLDYCPQINTQEDPNTPLSTHYRAINYDYHY